uniref:Phosphoprotein n=1 Tax=Hepatitis E virus TaxID=1678143 RepID=A0A2Z5CVY8_HEV|nr:phosphoprotein [Hepatitis E virus]
MCLFCRYWCCTSKGTGCRCADCCSCLLCVAECLVPPRQEETVEGGARHPVTTVQPCGLQTHAPKEPSAPPHLPTLSPQQVLARYQM